jgi:hypothetical protein
VVQGCTRTKQTFWTEDQSVATTSSDIRDHDTGVVEIVSRELEKAKPGKWGRVQAHELWSPKEEVHMCPGHNCLLKFGKVPGRKRCVEKEFKLGPRKYEEYKGLRFRDGDYTLVVDVWMHQVTEDTFEVWAPSVDTDASQAPVAMIVNSSDLRATDFDLREVIPLQLETTERGGRHTRGTADSRHGYHEVCTLRG